MVKSARAVDGDDTPGRRLERYIKERWTRKQGGIRGLATAIQSSSETIYSWFRGDSEPSMAHLRAIAEAIGVKPFEIVAAMDGDVALSMTDSRTEEALRPLIERVLDERLGPPQEDGGRAGAA